MSNDLIRIEDLPNVLEELAEAFYDIPFGNSAYQNECFVVAAQQTPARAYRAIGLNLESKIRAVKEAQLSKMRSQIDIEEKEAKIADEKTSEFDKRRLRLDIMEIRDGEAAKAKLLNDALVEMNTLYALFKRFPRFTRKQFEGEEVTHFKHRLDRQIRCHGNGSLESLENMASDLPGFEKAIALTVAHLQQIENSKAAG